MPSSAATGGFPEDTHARGLRHGSGSGSGSAKKPTSLSATLRHRASGSPPTGSCARQYRWLEEVAPILERKLSWPRMLFPVALFLVPVLSLASCVVSSEPGGQAIRQLQTERLGSWLPGPPDALGTRQSRAARLCSSNPTRPRVIWSGRSFLRGGDRPSGVFRLGLHREHLQALSTWRALLQRAPLQNARRDASCRHAAGAQRAGLCRVPAPRPLPRFSQIPSPRGGAGGAVAPAKGRPESQTPWVALRAPPSPAVQPWKLLKLSVKPLCKTRE